MRRADVIVIGAGPAGCAAATVLAACGRAVLLIDRPSGARRALAESIPPSARRLLSELGMEDAVDAAGFEPWLGNTVWWADEAPRIETFPAGATGFQVERDRFDAVLRKVAVNAGAQVLSGLVREISLPEVTVETAGAQVRVAAPWVIDASGRAGVIARRGLRVNESSLRTVALAGIWRAAGAGPDAQRGHTLVASHADGWAWSVPVAPGRRYFTVMVDPERSRLTRDASSRAVYLAELAKVRPFAPLLAAARLEDGPWGADASLYGTRRHAGPGFLLAGDAAACIDPLSSFGVKKALASGWLAGVTVNTILGTSSMQAAALEFFEARERAVTVGVRRQAARYAETVGVGHPFWEARSADATGTGQDAGDDAGPDDVDPAALARDPAVLAALRDLQARPAVALRVGESCRVEARPVIRGRSLVLEDTVVLPAWPRGLRYIRNVDLVLVTRLAPEHSDMGALCESIVRIQPGVSLPDVLGVLATLMARGALRHAEK